MLILVTGFEPFGGESINPAWLAVERLENNFDGAEIKKLLLPVCFGAAGDAVREAILSHKPDAVIMVGQAGGRKSIAVETTAVNLDNTTCPDNAGDCPVNVRIREDGPDTLPATIPVDAACEAINALGVPAELSSGAGTYVCNHIMYCAFDTIRAEKMACRAGFIHVPYIPEQAERKNAPSMLLDDMVRALGAVVRTLIQTQSA